MSGVKNYFNFFSTIFKWLKTFDDFIFVVNRIKILNFVLKNLCKDIQIAIYFDNSINAVHFDFLFLEIYIKIF